jgi:hypothetical protein
MYLYIRNWNIIHKSENKKLLLWFLEWCQIYEDNQKWNLIFEDGKIKIYEQSKQREEDSNKYHLTKELQYTKKKNKELEIIANTKIKSERKHKKNKEPTEYEKKLYILKNLWNA